MSKVKANEIESITGLSAVLVKDLVKALPSAWVNFDAFTGAIVASYNMTSVTRIGTGRYDVQPNGLDLDTTAVVATVGGVDVESISRSININRVTGDPFVTTNIRNGGNNLTDIDMCSVVFYGGKTYE